MRGCGFKSRRHIMDEHDVFHCLVVKKLYCLFEKTENKQKEAGVCQLKKTIYIRAAPGRDRTEQKVEIY